MIERTQTDPWVKEMAKFEQRDVFVNGGFIRAIPVSEGGRGGAEFAEYPKMLFRAEAADGGYRISGTKLVADEGAERIACGQGWCVTQEEAIAGGEARQRELATLAANRAHNDRWMSEAARKEAQAADEATAQHLPSIPETPIQRRQVKETK